LKGLELNQMLIVDNQMFSYASNLQNGVPILDFQGQKKDTELKKLTYYLLQIAGSENLPATNEATFNFERLMQSQLDRFIKYYNCNSEYTESDFDDNGCSCVSSQSDAHEAHDVQFDYFNMIPDRIEEERESPNLILKVDDSPIEKSENSFDLGRMRANTAHFRITDNPGRGTPNRKTSSKKTVSIEDINENKQTQSFDFITDLEHQTSRPIEN
jgi:hypothetical protein